MTSKITTKSFGILNAILILAVINISQSLQCSYNIKCSSSCLMRMCQYDSNTNQYFFDNCCKGCIDEYFWDQPSKKCIQNSCSTYFFQTKKYWWFRNNTCLQKCPVEFYFQQIYQLNPWVASDVTARCMKVCPPGYYSYGKGNQSRECVSECPSGYYKQEYNGSHLCTNNCSKLGQMYLKTDTKQCTPCTNLTGYYRYYDGQGNITCTKSCPQNHTKFNYVNGPSRCVYNPPGACSYPYILDKQTNSCIYCQLYNSQYTLQNIDSSKQCDRYCPVKYYLHPKTNKCYESCSKVNYPQLYYHDNLQMICADIGECSFNEQKNIQTFGSNSSASCVNQCPNASYGHSDLKICVQNCFGEYPFKNINTNMCQKTQTSISISISTGDNVEITKTMIIIGAVAFGAFAILVVLVAFGIDKCCCKKHNQFQHIETQTPQNDEIQENKSLYSSQFLKQIEIQTQNSNIKKKPTRTPSFL